MKNLTVSYKYILKDIKGGFYEQELQKTKHEDIYLTSIVSSFLLCLPVPKRVCEMVTTMNFTITNFLKYEVSQILLYSSYDYQDCPQRCEGTKDM